MILETNCLNRWKSLTIILINFLVKKFTKITIFYAHNFLFRFKAKSTKDSLLRLQASKTAKNLMSSRIKSHFYGEQLIFVDHLTSLPALRKNSTCYLPISRFFHLSYLALKLQLASELVSDRNVTSSRLAMRHCVLGRNTLPTSPIFAKQSTRYGSPA